MDRTAGEVWHHRTSQYARFEEDIQRRLQSWWTKRTEPAHLHGCMRGSSLLISPHQQILQVASSTASWLSSDKWPDGCSAADVSIIVTMCCDLGTAQERRPGPKLKARSERVLRYLS